MAFLTMNEARAAALRETNRIGKSATAILREHTSTSRTSFDIFLSHSKMDSELVLGAKKILEEKGYSVYVDWIEDQQLDRSQVNRETADLLRRRMRQCALMFYLHTENAALSKWCPWELGFFDGHTQSKHRTYIFPLVAGSQTFKAQEYLELYPVVEIDNVGMTSFSKNDVYGKLFNGARIRMSAALSGIH
ncbi:TIR domain-containing protein [Palleronia sp. KMU-117]|uniref:TIR domain-containing protein n=1 Tax=Palleronia sp. KMU-117 TaxID=3434108 RepID=UPI003D71663A